MIPLSFKAFANDEKAWIFITSGNVTAIPGPAHESVKLVFNSKCECEYSLLMSDITGRIVYKEKFLCKKGEITKVISHLSEFPHGSYIITISNSSDEAIRIKIEH